MKAADEEKRTLNKNIALLERNIGSIRVNLMTQSHVSQRSHMTVSQEDHPLVVCLIDGDGNIFSSELYAMGRPGGLQAAMLLTKSITEYLNNTITLETARGQIWLTIFFNKSGLSDTLVYNNVCTAEEFDAFVIGFNQASPLFCLIDVGGGKEAADSKVKGESRHVYDGVFLAHIISSEYLRVFTRFPQTTRVLFGGASATQLSISDGNITPYRCPRQRLHNYTESARK